MLIPVGRALLLADVLDRIVDHPAARLRELLPCTGESPPIKPPLLDAQPHRGRRPMLQRRSGQLGPRFADGLELAYGLLAKQNRHKGAD